MGKLQKNAGNDRHGHDLRNTPDGMVEEGPPPDVQVDDNQQDKNPGGADGVHYRYDIIMPEPAPPGVFLLCPACVN